jgi:Putative beta-barrel porin-2, OmpL-like. bbp2
MKRSCVFEAFGRAASVAVAVLATSAVAHADPTEPEPPPPSEPWYDAIQLRGFVDGYASINYNLPKPQTNADINAPQHANANRFRTFDRTNGLSLSWVGLDASYDPSPVGGTVQLRFGPSANLYADRVTTDPDSNYGLEYVKQAFASWKPWSFARFDFGKFDTIYGAEVADSQDNMNYTRGILYQLGQPAFHTGLRAVFQVLPELDVTALAVNGWDRTIDNNVGKTYGLQVGFQPSDTFSAKLGWLGGPEQDDSTTVNCDADTAYDPTTGGCAASPGAAQQSYVVDRGGSDDLKAWRHLIDLVVTYQPIQPLTLVVNADFGTEGLRDLKDSNVTRKQWYGGMLGARYQLTGVWAVAARGEYFRDPQGYRTGTNETNVSLATGTLTIEAKPTDNLILRLENRGDFVLTADGSKDLFQRKVRDAVSHQVTTTLGVVVTTN